MLPFGSASCPGQLSNPPLRPKDWFEKLLKGDLNTLLKLDLIAHPITTLIAMSTTTASYLVL